MEVGVQSMSMAASLAKRVVQNGGAALIIDYGQDRLLDNSLQAIAKHKFVHPLSLPGSADISCRVDFSALRYSCLHDSECLLNIPLACLLIKISKMSASRSGKVSIVECAIVFTSSKAGMHKTEHCFQMRDLNFTEENDLVVISLNYRQGALESGVDVAVHGPIPQAQFLGGLGIEARLDALLERATMEEQTSLINGFNRLVGSQEEALPQGLSSSSRPSDSRSGNLDRTIEGNEEQEQSLPEVDQVQGIEGKGPSLLEEGMGLSYKVMAITSAGTPPPVPFSYKSLESSD